MKHFAGSTRRPRNVNLSGKSKPSSGLAIAREERARRELERQRLTAAIKIQSVYRGHNIRRSIRTKFRADWDHSVGFPAAQPLTAFPEDALALLLFFCDVTNTEDFQRLSSTVSTLHPSNEPSSPVRLALTSGGRSRMLTARFSRMLLASLSFVDLSQPTFRVQSLRILSFLSCAVAYLQYQADTTYFNAVKLLVAHGLDPLQEVCPAASAIIIQSIALPLQSVIGENRPFVYTCFLQSFLATPSLDKKLFSTIPISAFRRLLDVRMLLEAAGQLRIDALIPESIIWLLSYLLAFVYDAESPVSPSGPALEYHVLSHSLYQKISLREAWDSKTNFGLLVNTLTPILDTYSTKIGRQADVFQTSSILPRTHVQADFYAGAEEYLNPPEFVKHQLDHLLMSDFLLNLTDVIIRDRPFSSSSSSPSSPPASLRHTRHAAQTFTLQLLLNFRFLQRKLHNRLFLARSRDGRSLLVALYQQIHETNAFRNGLNGFGGILEGLKLNCDRKTTNPSPAFSEWTSILLFLDLYCFSSIVIDDEEFFAFNGRSLAPNQLQHLICFLKNLAFVSYFEVSEIESQTSDELFRQLSSNTDIRTRTHPRLDVAGVYGVSLAWVRNLTIRILRSLHRRDSRQNFLPDGFWLMKEVVTEGTTHLIAEEEARHQEFGASDEIADSDSDSGDEGSQATPENRNKNFSRRHEKTSRHNYMAAITPRLGVLQTLPFFIPFRTRVSIFRDFVRLDQTRRGTGDRELWRLNQANSFLDQPGGKAKHHGVIHRDRVFEDAYDEFYSLGDGFKEPIQITFVDSFGAEEPGIDGGGILKEFLSSLVQESSRTDSATGTSFFAETENHALYPNPVLLDEMSWDPNETFSLRASTSREVVEVLRRFEFLGRIIGKCMYEGILVDVVFADFFLLKWSKVMLGNDDVGLGVDDLKSLDRGLWKGLQALKNYDERMIEDLELTFAIENILRVIDPQAPNRHIQRAVLVDLKPNGSQIPVTYSNRLEYIHLVSRYRLSLQGKQQTNAFLKGLSSIISPRWLSMFNQSELQILVGGNESPLDIDDLRKNTVYGGIYTIGDDNQEHETIRMFWRVMKRLGEPDKRAVLKFVTSVSRAPLLGFGSLNPRFSIRDAGSDSTRLPSTSTCVNLLKLPRYQSEGVLEEKLLYAANAGAGFDLS